MCGESSGTAVKDGMQETGGPAILPFAEVVRFHGHLCPGVTLGYCASKIALRELYVGRDVDEHLVAIVENDACGVDAIQAVTGCTLGKGNLIFRDYGKHVYTFINRATKDAVRISLKERKSDDDPEQKASRPGSGKAGLPGDKLALKRLRQEKIDAMLTEPRRSTST